MGGDVKSPFRDDLDVWLLCLVIDAGPQLLASAQASTKDLWYSRRQCLNPCLWTAKGSDVGDAYFSRRPAPFRLVVAASEAD